uniref:Vesicle transport protein n=1 Tax=Capra hircus TaxID=9925 RepID=A0A8C2S2G9_CAPHI
MLPAGTQPRSQRKCQSRPRRQQNHKPRPFRPGGLTAARSPSSFQSRPSRAGSGRQPQPPHPPAAATSRKPPSNMADLNRQLQEYLAQGKAGGPAAAEPLLAAGEAKEPTAEAGAWLSRAGLRWTSTQSPAEPAAGQACLPSVTRTQRLAASGVCLLLAALCFGLAALYAPVLLLRARKFALLWSLGSALALAGGTLLRGGAACGRLLRGEEAPSRPALLYVVALGATLYAALCLRSTLLTALGACAQVAALLARAVGRTQNPSPGCATERTRATGSRPSASQTKDCACPFPDRPG